MRAKHFFLITGLLAAILFSGLQISFDNKAQAAADYAVTSGIPFQVVTVTTGATIKVTLAGDDFSFSHLGLQNDGTTASVSTDYVVVMREKDTNGAAVTLTADATDGVKLIVFARGSGTFPGRLIPNGTDGPAEVQIRAVGNGCKLQIMRGRSPAE